MAEDAVRTENRPRLGRGSAALLGRAERGRGRGRARRAPDAGRVPAPQSAQSAQAVRRGRARGARRLDQGARDHPAGDRPRQFRRRGRLRDHRRRAPLAGGAAGRPARNARPRRRGRRPGGARNRDRRKRAARRSQRARRGRGLRASSAPITAIRTATSRASSAKAAATSPTRCGWSTCPNIHAACSRAGRFRPDTRARCSRSPTPMRSPTASSPRAHGPGHRAPRRKCRQDERVREKAPRPSTPTRGRFRTSSRWRLGAKVTIRHDGEARRDPHRLPGFRPARRFLPQALPAGDELALPRGASRPARRSACRRERRVPVSRHGSRGQRG